MNLTIYTCCEMQNGIFSSEDDWRMEWSDVAPQLGTVVSMESEERWRIVKITVYRSETVQEIDDIYLAYLYPVGKPIPPDLEWNDESMDATESIYAEIVALGKMELGLGPIESVRVPKVGEQTETNFDPTIEDWPILEQPKWWTVQRVVTYSPVVEMRLVEAGKTNYAKTFVCWYEPSETTPTT